MAFDGAYLDVNGSTLGSNLQQMLLAEDIQPGSDPSWELVRQIYLYHPLGAKMADAPIEMALSQRREVTVNAAPSPVLKAYWDEWERIVAEEDIFAVGSAARIYGVATIGVMCEEFPPDEEIPADRLARVDLSFSVFDPLNTAGSLVLNQNTHAMDFMKFINVTVNGQTYHRSRAVVLMNERPMYIAWSNPAFGFSGRSVYQRALYPLKSFIRSMITDDMVVAKAGLLVIKKEPAGSIVNNVMAKVASTMRSMVQSGVTGNVLTIGPNEGVDSLNLRNLEGPLTTCRTDILKNIATAAGMPAKILDNETLVAGFGEGTEDAKNIARYIDGVRRWLDPVFEFYDQIVMRRAWNEEFYDSIQEMFPDEYRGVPYETAFRRWESSFTAEWPNLLTEPDSEKIAVDKSRAETLISTLQVLLPEMDGANKAAAIEWLANNLNQSGLLLTDALDLDIDALTDHLESAGSAEAPMGGEGGDRGEGDGGAGNDFGGEGHQEASEARRAQKQPWPRPKRLSAI